MKIGLLTTSFPRVEEDLPGAFVLGFARALAARGHRLEVLAPEPHERVFLSPPSFPNIGVHWVRYLAPRALERTFYGAGVLDNLREQPLVALGLAPFVGALARAAYRRAPAWDALISHWALPCALIAGELARGRPHLAVLHSADVFVLERMPAVVRRVLAARIAAGASALLFASRDLRRRFLALFAPVRRAEVAARAHVCAMGIEPAADLPESRAAVRRRLQLTRFTVLSLGRLIPLKGVAHAIDALVEAPEFELVIAGDGPERPALERYARERDVRARFVGIVRSLDKQAWLQAADAFVLPSIRLPDGRSEGMPTAVLEAMEHGLPVVASDVGGVSDVVHDGENGFLVPPARPEAIVLALRALRTPIHSRLAQGARETAALYHWSALAPELERLLAPGQV